MYKKSKYLIKKFSKKENAFFLYHSIFGNLIRMNKELHDYLFSKVFFTNEELKKNLVDEEYEFFINNYFLLKENMDEQDIILKKLEDRRKNLSLGQEFEKLQLIVANSCNFSCKYCFCEHFSKEKNNEFMNFDVAERAILESIKVLKKNNKKILTVSFFGGEPSLNFNLIEQILVRFENFYDGITIKYEYTSNGSLMNEKLAELFFKYSVLVSFSIDYLNKNNLAYRGDGKNNYPWDKIEDNIKLLVKKGVTIEVASVLSTETYNGDFYFLVDKLKDYGIKRIFLILSFDIEFYKNFSVSQIVNKVFDYYLYCFKYDISLEGYWYDSFSLIVDPVKFKERETYKTCPSIGKMISIEPNGKIFACKTTNINLGIVTELKDIFQKEQYQHYAMRAYINSEKCKGCEIQGFCSGNCAGSNENNFGTIYEVNSLFCEVMKGIINKLLEFYIEE